jgi:hypothetical protein
MADAMELTGSDYCPSCLGLSLLVSVMLESIFDSAYFIIGLWAVRFAGK